MAKHTPGPWYSRNGSSPHFQGQIASESTGATVAISYSDEDGANARLIAAAPDLLDACLRMRDRLTELANDQDACWLDWGGAYYVDAAIAKATS